MNLRNRLDRLEARAGLPGERKIRVVFSQPDGSVKMHGGETISADEWRRQRDGRRVIRVRAPNV